MEISKNNFKASTQEAKNLAIESLNSECRTVGKKYFDCVENQISAATITREFDYNKVQNDLATNGIPDCLKKFDLESCLQSYN